MTAAALAPLACTPALAGLLPPLHAPRWPFESPAGRYRVHSFFPSPSTGPHPNPDSLQFWGASCMPPAWHGAPCFPSVHAPPSSPAALSASQPVAVTFLLAMRGRCASAFPAPSRPFTRFLPPSPLKASPPPLALLAMLSFPPEPTCVRPPKRRKLCAPLHLFQWHPPPFSDLFHQQAAYSVHLPTSPTPVVMATNPISEPPPPSITSLLPVSLPTCRCARCVSARAAAVLQGSRPCWPALSQPLAPANQLAAVVLSNVCRTCPVHPLFFPPFATYCQLLQLPPTPMSNRIVFLPRA